MEANNPAATRRVELTIRGIILAILITVVFTAANIYLGLKAGLTFTTTIPAAVISMAVLSTFKNSSIYENNIVQTLASAAGTLSSIIFVLPGLIIVGWWTGFPFWESFAICAAGGVLGVTFTIPLRRALVTTSPLPYPEGVAAAEVLKVGADARGGATQEAREGLLAVIISSIASLGNVALQATQLAAPDVTKFFRVGGGTAGFGTSFSMALFGVGHLVGLFTGLAMLAGLLIGWVIALPIFTSLYPDPTAGDIATYAQHIWATKVRFVGAGTIAIAAIWTLGGLAKPVFQGLVAALTGAHNKGATPGDERDVDLSPAWVIGLSVLCLATCGWLVWQFAAGAGLPAFELAIAGVIAILVLGFLIAAICGYMAGLIGSSNSPLSGVGIISVVIGALVFMVVAAPSAQQQPALVAFTLFVTAIIFASATIANGNLQDLKTGQLVGATPWRQQVALVIGVIAGAIVIPPVMDLLAHAYGFAGAPHTNTITAQPLAAPQAGLISALALGVIQQKLDWGLIGIGAVVGAVFIAIDQFLRARKWGSLPPLGVGIGIYLPLTTNVPIVIGAVVGWWFERYADRTKQPEKLKRLGVLVASGLIVGESLFGVLLAGLIVGFNKDAPLAVVPADFAYALPIGIAVFTALTVYLYLWAMDRVKKA